VQDAVVKRIVLLALLAAAGCAARQGAHDTAAAARAPVDPPDHFLVGSNAGNETSEPQPDSSCRSPLVDPRDGTRLRLVWSSGGVGEYEVPAGRYGVGAGDVLRIECGTGRALGIVTRRPG
jgi:hypothetical protein